MCKARNAASPLATLDQASQQLLSDLCARVSLFQVVGCASLYLHDNEQDAEKPFAIVGHLAVEPRFRAGGIGRALLGYLERMVNEILLSMRLYTSIRSIVRFCTMISA